MLIGGNDLFDLDEFSVPWTAVAQAGGVRFRRLTHPNGHGAALVRRPGATVATDNGLGLAVSKSDLVDGHGRPSFHPGRQEGRCLIYCGQRQTRETRP